LLKATLEHLFAASREDDWGQPLGLYYSIYRIAAGRADESAIRLAQFCVFYIAAADLFDDVQDEDLAGKPHAHAGSAIAINSALTLLMLALDILGEVSAMEQSSQRKLAYLRLFNRVSLIAVSAQHRDLLGQSGARSRSEVETMHAGKTSSVALVCECAALVGGAREEEARRFFSIGSELAKVVQIIDDVRDLVSSHKSTDLANARSTYPLACFHEKATDQQRAELSKLLGATVVDLERIQELLEMTGAFDECAATVEQSRQHILRLLGEVGPICSHGLLLAAIVDQLASALYEPPPHRLRVAPGPATHSAIEAARSFQEAMTPLGFQGSPELRTWHLPICFYEPEHERIYLSDLDGLAEEVVPFHAELQGVSFGETERSIRASLPFLVAHELTHAWRDQMGLLGEAEGHEEFIANELAYAFVFNHDQPAAEAVLAAARRIRRGVSQQARANASALAADCRSPALAPRTLPGSPAEVALLHAEMILQIAAGPRPLEEIVTSFFGTNDAIAAE
jgi:geranylgeranyl pyrophosphate synthase